MDGGPPGPPPRRRCPRPGGLPAAGRPLPGRAGGPVAPAAPVRRAAQRQRSRWSRCDRPGRAGALRRLVEGQAGLVPRPGRRVVDHDPARRSAAADRRRRAPVAARVGLDARVGRADRARRRPCPRPLGVPLGAGLPSSMRRSCHALDRLAVEGCRGHRREVRRGRPARGAVRASAPTTGRRSVRCWPGRRSSPTTGNAPGRSSPGSPTPASACPRCPRGPGWATACPSCSRAPRPPSWCR